MKRNLKELRCLKVFFLDGMWNRQQIGHRSFSDSGCVEVSPRSRFLPLMTFLSVFLSSFWGVQGHNCLHADETSNDLSLKDRFLAEAPAQWREYSQRAQKLQGKYSFQLSQTLGDTIIYYTMELKRRGDERKLIVLQRSREIKNKREEDTFDVFGLNPNYGFVLSRTKASGPWTLREIVDPKHQSQFDPKSKIGELEADEIVNDLVRLSRELLIEIVQKPQFRVIACQTLREGEENLVKIVFDYPHETKSGEEPTQGGIFVLDPQHFWCLRSYNVHAKHYDAKTQTASVRSNMQFKVTELKELDEGFLVPKQAVRENDITLADGTRNHQKWILEYDLQFPKALPAEEEFTLTAFGLPEPVGLGKPIRWHLWLGLAGVVCLFLAVYLRSKKRRLFEGKA